MTAKVKTVVKAKAGNQLVMTIDRNRCVIARLFHDDDAPGGRRWEIDMEGGDWMVHAAFDRVVDPLLPPDEAELIATKMNYILSMTRHVWPNHGGSQYGIPVVSDTHAGAALENGVWVEKRSRKSQIPVAEALRLVNRGANDRLGDVACALNLALALKPGKLDIVEASGENLVVECNFKVPAQVVARRMHVSLGGGKLGMAWFAEPGCNHEIHHAFNAIVQDRDETMTSVALAHAINRMILDKSIQQRDRSSDAAKEVPREGSGAVAVRHGDLARIQPATGS